MCPTHTQTPPHHWLHKCVHLLIPKNDQDFQMAAYASASPEPQLLKLHAKKTPPFVRSQFWWTHVCVWKPKISLISVAYVKSGMLVYFGSMIPYLYNL